MKSLTGLFFILTFVFTSYGQQIPLPAYLPEGHPRLMATDKDKGRVQQQVAQEQWAKEVLAGIKARIDPYVEKTRSQPDWLLSRLMMYWKSKATQVYINGGVYAKADGVAPVPTPRFGSTRGVGSPFGRPGLEDIIPYMDDTKGVYFRNNSKSGSSLEWVEQSQVSGGSIESVNEEIMKLAKDAAFLYWLTNEEAYAKLAFGVLDTYLSGMYFRTEPIDLGNGHAQTLVGMTTFEVIQERILNELAYTYDFLYNYIVKIEKDEISKRSYFSPSVGLRGVYETALKKCIDLSIKNGVPHNNWNLHKSKFILKVAMVLDNNNKYADAKGREYYINNILNISTARQWSLPRFMDYGYDTQTGIWNECPGYSQSVAHELTMFINDYDNTFNQSLLQYMPVMYKAVEALPQYLFPNGLTTAFGDTYYGKLNTAPIADMVRLTQKYKERDKEVLYTKMLKLFNPGAGRQGEKPSKLPPHVSSFFTAKPLELDESVPAGHLKDYMTPTFYAPNVSWLVQRNKYDSKENGLMISQYASSGNHMHSNGIAMELYGKGYVLGAESGIGSSYFEKPYLEYYSQFPAHNTVMVDGVSKYPEMLSNHPFDLLGCYPASGQKEGFYPGITYSDVYFLEPESRSNQNRLMSIISTGVTTGYYVDIFRSRKQRGGDKFHDYFYHNLGQELTIKDAEGNTLPLQPSNEMGFAGGHLFALDYMWDKRSAKTSKDYEAVWKMSFPDNNHVYMNLWMKGYKDREVFSIKSPSVKSYRKDYKLPYDFYNDPYLTIAARQHGEAWKHPFVSVFEPTTEKEGRSVTAIQSFEVKNVSSDFVGLIVNNRSGRIDHIFSSVKEEKVMYNGITANATYAVISEQGKDFTLFMGNGKLVAGKGFSIIAAEKTNAVLEYKNGAYYFTSDKPAIITTPKGRKINVLAGDYKRVRL
ncbi:MAG: six-hairpin glycosidase [Niabella sp.]